MTRRGKWLAGPAVASALFAIACASTIFWLNRDTIRNDAGCNYQAQAFEKTVQDSRHWTEQDIPGIGDYLEIHWLGKAASDPCSRAPGPTDWHYQGFARLRPQDAVALQAARQWEHEAPEEIWPALHPFAPAAPQWLSARNDTAYRGRLHLDPATETLFFSLLHG